MKRSAAFSAISAEESGDSNDCSIMLNSEILRLIVRYAIFSSYRDILSRPNNIVHEIKVRNYRLPLRAASRSPSRWSREKIRRRQYGPASGERTRMGVLLGRFYHLSFRVLHPDREPVVEPLIERARQRAT